MRLLFVIHVLHLVRDVLEPVLGGFCLRNHVRELSTNDRLRMQWLPERLPLVDPPSLRVRVSRAVAHVKQTNAYFKHSSTTRRWPRAFVQHMTQRSWLKLLSMTKIPPPSSPRVFSTGTLTLSKVMYAVPADEEYEVLIGLVLTPSPRSTRMTVNPSSVLHPTVKLEPY